MQHWKWERRQRIYANAPQSAGRLATEAKSSRGAAERQAGGESKPETAAQAARLVMVSRIFIYPRQAY